MEPSDRELVLLARHRAAMHAVAVARLGPEADVEDVVLDASLVALTSLQRLRDPAVAEAVRTWPAG